MVQNSQQVGVPLNLVLSPKFQFFFFFLVKENEKSVYSIILPQSLSSVHCKNGHS